ncbi:MAG TPA: GDSL-type esterase/lipase family protein [Pyrinomonadaceae bacterium]
MRLLLILWGVVCLTTNIVHGSLPGSEREKYNFNSGWKVLVGDPKGASEVAFDDSSWKPVTTPYAWNEDDAFRKDIKDLSTGVAWYRKHFKLPADSNGRKVFLEFEGIRHAGEFYVNGKLIGRHENGVMAFGFDITDAVKPAPQENVLAVRVDNSWDYHEQATGATYQWSDRNFYANYGGINKNVYLHITNRLYQTLPLYSNLGTTGVYVYAQDFDIKTRSAKITAETQVRNEYATPKTFNYEVYVVGAGPTPIKTISGGSYTIAPGETKLISATARVDGLNFWSWGYGYLYNVLTVLAIDGRSVDMVSTRTGFRKTEFANGVMKLNDRVVQLKGYAQRTTNEWPALGSAVPAWLSDFSNRLMLESNANLVRWMHVTPWKQDIESCDRLGLMQAMPAGDSEKDVDGRRWEQRVELMRDAIIYNRNNPSIVFYESGNKGISEKHMLEMRALRDQYDARGGRAIGSREMLDSRVAEYGGEMLYINKSAHMPMWAMEYSRDEALRKYWDEYSPPFHKNGAGPLHQNQDASAYNRNQDSHAIENVARWYDYWRERPGTGERVSGGGVNIIFSDSNTHHRGAENYRRSGEVDAMRLPKDGYFAHQVMWDGWVDVERPRTHIIGHWNYAPGTKKDIYVVSSAEKVELFISGVSQGFGVQSNRFLFTFKDVAWQLGTIRAVGYDAAARKISEDSKQTAGEPVAIRLTPHTSPIGLRADGADVALIDVEVIDRKGQRCPTALNMINFSIDGPAEWRGGIAQGPDNYILSKSLPVENGVNRVIIRTKTQAGKIVVRATGDGLKPATTQIVSRSVQTTSGLSVERTDAALVSYLERGPTPAALPPLMKRQSAPIAKVSAGANSENARLTFDDNETTEWVSDGKLADGWIKYEFARPERISEVTLKLSNWRTRSYPLRILVDDKPVYSGETSRSLGYVTLSFPAVTGSNLKLELTGRPKDVDAFGQIVEVTGQKETGSADDKGRIGIVEIEIYDASQTNTSKSSINPKLPTIFVVGDSTANNNANGGRGWGDPFISLFDATKVNVLNRARAGRSSRTFITQGLWDNVLSEMERGDIVLIQFGHNDAGTINDESRARGSLPGTGEETEEIDNLLTKQHEVVHTFGWYLRKMIADTKAKGATPIVLSLTVRNIWKDGRVERGSGKFGQWSAEVAASQKVLFVDVTKLIADRYEQLGEAKVKELFATDNTHTNPAGAELNASIILTGLRTLRGKPFDPYLNHRLHR